MEAYIFQAALICERCAQHTKTILLSNPKMLVSEDSDRWPQGPYGNGGGESDCPQHCDHCGVFLENPLTIDGAEEETSNV